MCVHVLDFSLCLQHLNSENKIKLYKVHHQMAELAFPSLPGHCAFLRTNQLDLLTVASNAEEILDFLSRVFNVTNPGPPLVTLDVITLGSLEQGSNFHIRNTLL